MNREELEKMNDEELDELVYDIKAQEAATINNAGKEAQIDYLLSDGV